MNASHSPQVTGREASACGWSSPRWRGRSLSKANPRGGAPISLTPPSATDPAERRGGPARSGRGAGAIGGTERLDREPVLHVGEEQLLVLLLVGDAELHHLPDRVCGAAREERPHPLVHERRASGAPPRGAAGRGGRARGEAVSAQQPRNRS